MSKTQNRSLSCGMAPNLQGSVWKSILKDSFKSPKRGLIWQIFKTIQTIVVIMFEITSLYHGDYVKEEGYMLVWNVP